MLAVLILAVALSADAFAVSIALGAQHRHHFFLLACKIGLLFGVFHIVLLYLGFAFSSVLSNILKSFGQWLAFALLMFIGLNMIYEGFTASDQDHKALSVATSTLLGLAFATSIDAIALGFSLQYISEISEQILIALLIVGTTVVMATMLGFALGRVTGLYIGNKATILGGCVILAIGLKVFIV